MMPLFQAVVHTASRSVQKKEQAHTARKRGGIESILFYGLLLVLVLLVAWLANAFIAGQ